MTKLVRIVGKQAVRTQIKIEITRYSWVLTTDEPSEPNQMSDSCDYDQTSQIGQVIRFLSNFAEKILFEKRPMQCARSMWLS